jgi:hypothetical protein
MRRLRRPEPGLLNCGRVNFRRIPAPNRRDQCWRDYPAYRFRQTLDEPTLAIDTTRAIPPFAQRKLARLLDAQVQQIDGGHDGMVSNPVGTAAALNQSAPESARTDLKPRSPRRR